MAQRIDNIRQCFTAEVAINQVFVAGHRPLRGGLRRRGNQRAIAGFLQAFNQRRPLILGYKVIGKADKNGVACIHPRGCCAKVFTQPAWC